MSFIILFNVCVIRLERSEQQYNLTAAWSGKSDLNCPPAAQFLPDCPLNVFHSWKEEEEEEEENKFWLSEKLMRAHLKIKKKRANAN